MVAVSLKKKKEEKKKKEPTVGPLGKGSPARVDEVLRLFVVTPDMHRVHHSVIRREHDSNYGFNLSLWDRLFRTYTAQPEAGHQGMTIGLTPYQSEAPARFGWSLWLPFGKQPAGQKKLIGK